MQVGRANTGPERVGATSGAPGDVGIIGAGRFGSYFAAQLERVGYVVHRADVSTDAATYERDLGRACRASTVIYAVPIRSLERAVLETRDRLAPESVVLDVCSVKMIPCAILERHLPGRAVTGTHPLFGRESASETCAGQRVALCVPAGLRGTPAGAAGAARAEQLFTALGLTIVRCSPDDHDAQVARSQFLTHFIARGTTRCGIGRVALSTKTHDDLMDIVDIACHDSDELFEDMAAFNPMAARVRSEFLAALDAIGRHLESLERN
jgi:prephenate dehydrogenase